MGCVWAAWRRWALPPYHPRPWPTQLPCPPPPHRRGHPKLSHAQPANNHHHPNGTNTLPHDQALLVRGPRELSARGCDLPVGHRRRCHSHRDPTTKTCLWPDRRANTRPPSGPGSNHVCDDIWLACESSLVAETIDPPRSAAQAASSYLLSGVREARCAHCCEVQAPGVANQQAVGSSSSSSSRAVVGRGARAHTRRRRRWPLPPPPPLPPTPIGASRLLPQQQQRNHPTTNSVCRQSGSA